MICQHCGKELTNPPICDYCHYGAMPAKMTDQTTPETGLIGSPTSVPFEHKTGGIWTDSHRFDKLALPLADRHYNRQKPGTPQFVPPGRNVVFVSGDPVSALWVSSWPLYARHDWEGAWINTLFRREGGPQASTMIRSAVARTFEKWPDIPELGMVSFVDPSHVPPVIVRGERIYGYCYLKAGFEHVGFTKTRKLWVWQMLPSGIKGCAVAP